MPTETALADRLKANLDVVRARMADAALRSGRLPGEITLVAVTKRNPPELIRSLIDLGAEDLGENYPQELWEKVEALADRPARWHLIGHLQGNKLRRTFPLVRLIHGVDSPKLLKSLDACAAETPDPPGVLIQINASGEASKHGWSAESVLADSDLLASCRSIPILGLMTMAGYGTTDEEARPTFALLRSVRDRLREATGLALPELSMGMSGDFEAAIEEGATLVRIGSALFQGVSP